MPVGPALATVATDQALEAARRLRNVFSRSYAAHDRAVTHWRPLPSGRDGAG